MLRITLVIILNISFVFSQDIYSNLIQSEKKWVDSVYTSLTLEEKVSQFSWVATSGEHVVSVSTGATVKTVSISVESRALVEEENALNTWFYSIPVIIAAVGIIFIHRKWAEFRRISDDDDEFEWD